MDLKISRAEGSYLYDDKGGRYLDLISGIAVSHLGHQHPHILNRIQEQLKLFTHVMVYGEYALDIQEEFAARIISILGGEFDQLFLTNSGTEANEGALKLAKRVTGRTEIVSFHNSYHGSTHGSLSVSGNEYRKSAFRPLLPEVRFLNFNNIEQLDEITHNTAAVIIEPIQGDAGVRIASEEFLRALKSRCEHTGTMLIFDEVQSGFGRTGKWFAFQHYTVEPDIITMGKAMGAGLPVGGFAARRAVMETLSSDPPLGHITTYGGNPLACASGLAGIEIIEKEKILSTIELKGKHFEELLYHPSVVQIRRKGLMLAVDLESEEKVTQVVTKTRELGSLIYWFLSTKYSFRIAPPLNISKDDIHKGCRDILAALG